MNSDQMGVGKDGNNNKDNTDDIDPNRRSSDPQRLVIKDDIDNEDDDIDVDQLPHGKISITVKQSQANRTPSIDIDSSIEQELNRLDQQKKFQPSLARSTNAINFESQQQDRELQKKEIQPRVLAQSTDAIHHEDNRNKLRHKQQHHLSSDDDNDLVVVVSGAAVSGRNTPQHSRSNNSPGLLSPVKEGKIQPAKSTDAIIYYSAGHNSQILKSSSTPTPTPPPLPQRQTSKDSTSTTTSSSSGPSSLPNSANRSIEQELNQLNGEQKRKFQPSFAKSTTAIGNYGRQNSIELTDKTSKQDSKLSVIDLPVMAKSTDAINFYHNNKLGIPESSVDQKPNDNGPKTKSTGALNYHYIKQYGQPQKVSGDTGTGLKKKVEPTSPTSTQLAKSTGALSFHYTKNGGQTGNSSKDLVQPVPVELAKSTDAINYQQRNKQITGSFAKSTGDINRKNVNKREQHESDDMVYHEIDHPLNEPRGQEVSVDIVPDGEHPQQPHLFVQHNQQMGNRHNRLYRQHNIRRSDQGKRAYLNRPKVYSSNTTIPGAMPSGDDNIESTPTTPIKLVPIVVPTTGGSGVHASRSQSNLYNRQYNEEEEFPPLNGRTKSFSFLRNSAHNLSKMFHFDKNTFVYDYKNSHRLDPEYDLNTDDDDDSRSDGDSSDDNLLQQPPPRNVTDQMLMGDRFRSGGGGGGGIAPGQHHFEGAGAGIGIPDSTSYKFPQPRIKPGYDTDDPDISNQVVQMMPRMRSNRRRSTVHGRIRKRVILKHGNINLCNEHLNKRNKRYLHDLFTTMVDIRWRWNLMVFAMGFLVSWTSFAIIWWLIAFSHSDFDHIDDEEWHPCVVNINSFLSTLLFSIETQHTIGYGSRYTTEECPEAILVMCLQSITGVMIQCFMVGFVFSKLSRPQKRSQTLMFSRNAVICVRDSKLCLMFRVGDLRNRSHIIGGKITAQLIRKKISPEGEVIPYYHCDLPVRFDEVGNDVFLIWPVIIVHEINADSPFYHMNIDAMMREKFEIVAILEGTVESTGQTIQARTSFLPSEILWGFRFEQLVKFRKQTGEYMVDYAKFNSTYETNTPTCSGAEYAKIMRETNFDVDEDHEDHEDHYHPNQHSNHQLRGHPSRGNRDNIYDLLPPEFVHQEPPKSPSAQVDQQLQEPNSPNLEFYRKAERVTFEKIHSSNSTPSLIAAPPTPQTTQQQQQSQQLFENHHNQMLSSSQK